MLVIDDVHCLQQLEVFFFPLLIGHLEQIEAAILADGNVARDQSTGTIELVWVVKRIQRPARFARQ